MAAVNGEVVAEVVRMQLGVVERRAFNPSACSPRESLSSLCEDKHVMPRDLNV